MTPLCTSLWDIPLSLLIPTRGISLKAVNLLSHSKFDGEGHVSAFTHLNQFDITQQNLNIVQDNEICRLFILTFEGRIKTWLRKLSEKSIHSWKQFMEVFIVAHEYCVYDELFNELKEICGLENESENDFFQRVMQIYYSFPKNDKPSCQ
jgi:hypothetical protein